VLEYRYFAVLTALVTYGLIVLGGTVRSTNSGTACPDWPLCHGKVVPQFEYHVMIEYSHRLVASVVGFLILAMMIWGWRRYRGLPLYSAGAIIVLVLLGGQVLLGGATVETETAASVVAAHLTMALTLFSILIVMAVTAFLLDAGRVLPAFGGPGGHFKRLLILPFVTLAGLFVLIIVGAYVSQIRMLAAVVGVLVVGLAWQVLDEDRRPLPSLAVGFAVALYAAQVLVGASNIWFELATPVRILHLALASAVWGTLVVAVAYRHLTAQDRVVA
jgi:heme A synthase